MTRALRVTVTIPEEIVATVDSMAKRRKVSRSRVVTEILDRASREARRKALIAAYQAMSEENTEFAQSAQPLAAEVWPEYPRNEPAEGEEGA